MTEAEDIVNASIMFLTDDSDTSYSLARVLQKHGFRVFGYSDPNFALEEFKPKRYDMIILDTDSANRNGFELAEQIWVKDPDARICFCSAFYAPEQEARVVFGNFKSVGFIKKPVTATDLVNCITKSCRSQMTMESYKHKT